MRIIHTVQEMKQVVHELNAQGKRVGFVPTMGYLHEGHKKLMEEARKENDIVVTSIFVNPLQFGPGEDYERYPRDETRDQLAAQEEAVDLLFYPHVQEMYPRQQTIQMNVQQRVNVLCGQSREGHFDGVVMVLTKLFNIVHPDRVYFGMKDAQQVAVVDALIEDYNFPIKLCPVETVREKDGLAKSSRNVYLSNDERAEAPSIYQALLHGRELVKQGEKSPKVVVEEVTRFIQAHTRGKIDYVDCLAYPELEQVETINRQMIIAVAVHFDQARLIDNVLFDSDGQPSTAIV